MGFFSETLDRSSWLKCNIDFIDRTPPAVINHALKTRLRKLLGWPTKHESKHHPNENSNILKWDNFSGWCKNYLIAKYLSYIGILKKPQFF